MRLVPGHHLNFLCCSAWLLASILAGCDRAPPAVLPEHSSPPQQTERSREPSEGGSSGTPARRPAVPPAAANIPSAVPDLGTDSYLPTDSSGLPSGTTLRASLLWRSDSFDTDNAPPPLEVDLILQGDILKNAVAYGRARLSSARTDRARLKRLAIEVQDTVRGMTLVDRQETWVRQPGDGIVVPLGFHHPRPEATQIALLEGTLTTRIAARQSPKSLPRVMSLVDGDVDDSDLRQAGWSLTLDRNLLADAPQTLLIHLHPEAALSEIVPLDADGERLRNVFISSEIADDGRPEYRITALEFKLPEDLQLKFVLQTDFSDIDSEFRFENLPLPPLPSNSGRSEASGSDWKLSEETVGVPEGLIVEGRARWCELISFNSTGAPEPRPLEVAVDLTGPLGLQGVAYGNFRVKTAIADGEKLIPATEGLSMMSEAMDKIIPDEPLGFSSQRPPDGVQAIFSFQHPQQIVRSIDEFAGQLTLATATSQEEVRIADALAAQGEPLQSASLERAGLRLIPVLASGQLSIAVEGADPLLVRSMTAIDAAGTELAGIYGSRITFGEKTQFLFVAEEDFPEQLGLRIVIHHGLQRHEVPFQFSSLPVGQEPATPLRP